MQILGIDIGGTGIKWGLVETSTGALIGEKQRIDTPKPATPEAIGAALQEIIAKHAWTGPIGIGLPAAVVHGITRTAANIDKSFIGLPVVDYFASLADGPLFVANDADVAGLAEMRFGAGQGQRGVVLIVTIGTGLGTALFCDGRLTPNTELGHILLDNGQEAERYASEAVRITQNLKWKTWGPRINHTLCTLEQLLWPDLIILGGGVSKKLEKFAPYLSTQAPVVAADFLNQAGIVGAALFAEEELLRCASERTAAEAVRATSKTPTAPRRKGKSQI